MMRLLLLIPLGLSLLSCDEPGRADYRKQSDVLPHERRSDRHQAVSSRSGGDSVDSGVVDPVEDLRKSLEHAEGMTSPDAREKALADVVWNAVEIHPETAHAAFHQLSANSAEKLRLLRHYAMRLAADNPEDAIEWASGLESKIEISAVISHIALELSSKDPVRAAHLLFDYGIEGRDFDVAVVQVVQRWAASSPPDAVAWVEKFTAGNVREASLQAVFERWLLQDTGAAIQWAESIQDASLRGETESAISSVLIQQPDTTRKRLLDEDTSGLLSKILINPKGDLE
jgi:hypothetical protein